MLKYKGYVGTVEYDPEAKLFHGDVVGLRDVITFQGTTPDEIEQAFKDSINVYLEWCKERKIKPEKSFSGKIHLRLSSDLHARLAKAAQVQGLSLNSYIAEKLQRAK